MSVLVNQGSGTFAAPLIYGTAYTATGGLAAANLTGDGRPDLAVTSSFTDSVSVMVNTCLP